jgi:hypothetical protein
MRVSLRQTQAFSVVVSEELVSAQSIVHRTVHFKMAMQPSQSAE